MSETDNKNTPEDVYIKRFTKQQVAEVHDLLEEGKSLEDISLFFQKKYKCKPIPISRLRSHLTKFYKLKRMSENTNSCAENNKNHSLQPPVSIITNQDIQELKEKMFSPPPANTLSNSVENYKIVSKEREDDIFSGINLKFLFFIVIILILIAKILRRRTEKKKKEPKPEPESIEERLKRQGLKIKWV